MYNYQIVCSIYPTVYILFNFKSDNQACCLQAFKCKSKFVHFIVTGCAEWNTVNKDRIWLLIEFIIV